MSSHLTSYLLSDLSSISLLVYLLFVWGEILHVTYCVSVCACVNSVLYDVADIYICILDVFVHSAGAKLPSAIENLSAIALNNLQ